MQTLCLGDYLSHTMDNHLGHRANIQMTFGLDDHQSSVFGTMHMARLPKT